MRSFYLATEKINEYLSSHPLVKVVTFGDIFDVDLNKQTIFPLAHIMVNQATFADHVIRFNVSVLCMDIVDETKQDIRDQNEPFFGVDNQQDILNTTLAILNGLQSQLRRGTLYTEKYEIEGDIVCEPFTERFESLLTGLMSRQQLVQAALTKFAKRVIQQARQNLTKKKKNSTKELYNSLDYDLAVGPNSFSLTFSMEPYGEFQDKGVSGVKRKFNTPYKYTNKMPPPKAFANWVVRKGLEGVRDKNGRFIPRKSLQWAIAKSVYNNGIKPSYFFSAPFKVNFKKLPQEIVQAFELTPDDFQAFTRK
jgi:hypothetical protein